MQLDQCSTRLGVASTRANIVQVVGEVAGVAALAVGDTTSQEVKDGKVQPKMARKATHWLELGLDPGYA